MTRTRKRWLLGAGVAALALTLAGWAGSRVWAQRVRELPPLETELPEFDAPDPSLPTAPSREAFGLAIGELSLAATRAQLRARGLDCEDTSIRASVAKLREYKRDELAAAGDPDAVSGASILWRRSNKERNPQVRLACELDSIARFERGTTSAPTRGRALFVFDSPEHSLRHASLRRTYTDSEAALLDVRESVARFVARYGPPSFERGVIAAAGEAPAKPEPIKIQWRYADLLVEVTLTRFGKMVSVDERVEVPWPVRTDGP
jgi:hypothetical protein